MKSPHLLAKSLLCCFWLAGVVLVEDASGDEDTSTPAATIILSTQRSAKTLPPPSRVALSEESVSGEISIAIRSRHRHLHRTRQAIADAPGSAAAPGSPAPIGRSKTHLGRVTSGVSATARSAARPKSIATPISTPLNARRPVVVPIVFPMDAALTEQPTAPRPHPASPEVPFLSLANATRQMPSEVPRVGPREVPPEPPPEVPPVANNDELFPPLSGITLGQAARSESLAGEDVPIPDNAAQPFQQRYGRFLDISGYRGTPRPTLLPFSLHHHPLYFEDPNLERCGLHHGCLTDTVSAVRFFGRVPLTPYLMGSQPPGCHVVSPGQCRSCQAFGCDAYLPELNPEGVGWQTAMTIGFFFLFP